MQGQSVTDRLPLALDCKKKNYHPWEISSLKCVYNSRSLFFSFDTDRTHFLTKSLHIGVQLALFIAAGLSPYPDKLAQVLFFHRRVINGGVIVKAHRDRRRIFIVDAQPVVHEGMRSIIGNQDDLIVCGKAFDVSQALELLETLTPDLVIVDISLGDADGIQLIEEIGQLNADLPILVFSARPESDYAEPVLSAGASGYLMKNESSEIIVSAMHTVLEGDIYLSEPMKAELLSSVIGRSDKPSKPGSGVGSLSPREFEVFRLMGKGNTTREIAQQLHRSISTIQSHVERIKQKLGLNNATELMACAVKWMEGQE